MQLTQSDLEALDDRLRNWGRWAADRPAVGSSYLWRAMKKYGKDDETEGDDEQDSKPPKVDVLDALLVERAWVSLAESPFMYHQAKWTLRLTTAFQGNRPRRRPRSSSTGIVTTIKSFSWERSRSKTC